MAVRPRARSPRLVMVTLVAVSIVVITVDFQQGESGPLAGMGRSALAVISPLQEAVSKITRPIGDFLSAVSSLPSLKAENERLKAELDQARAQLVSQAGAIADLQEYERLFDLQKQIDRQTSGALVIANGVSNFEWTITIDKGADDGVLVGDAVVASRGLVGQVVRTTGSASDVRLITDPESGVWGQIVGTDDPGIVTGRGENDMEMRLLDPALPQEELTGKAVETIGYSERGYTNAFPPHLPIGSVVSAKESAGELDKEVTVAPAVDFASLDAVLVVHQERTAAP